MVRIIEPAYIFSSPGEHLCGLAFDGQWLWHSDGAMMEIYQIEIPTGRVVKTLDCPGIRTGLAYDGQHLCQIVDSPNQLRFIDPATGATMR